MLNIALPARVSHCQNKTSLLRAKLLRCDTHSGTHLRLCLRSRTPIRDDDSAVSGLRLVSSAIATPSVDKSTATRPPRPVERKRWLDEAPRPIDERRRRPRNATPSDSLRSISFMPRRGASAMFLMKYWYFTSIVFSSSFPFSSYPGIFNIKNNAIKYIERRRKSRISLFSFAFFQVSASFTLNNMMLWNIYSFKLLYI